MNKKWQFPVRRMLALLLCVASLVGMLPVLQQEAKAADNDAGLLWLDGKTDGSDPVPTRAYLDYYWAYGYNDNIWSGSKVLIRSAKYGHVMSYNPERANATSYTGSLTYDHDGDSLGTYYEVLEGDAAEQGLKNGDLYFDPSVRNEALWIIRQMIDSNDVKYADEQINDGNAMHYVTDLFVDMDPLFGGKIFPGVHLQKGKTLGQNASFWYSDGVSNDSGLFRHLCFRIESATSRPFTGTDVWDAQTTGWTPRGYIIEMLPDGRCLIYFRMGWRDMRVLNCDENGIWTVKRYQFPAEMGDDRAQALAAIIADEGNFHRLYAYSDDQDTRLSLSYKGYTEYNVAKGISEAEVLEIISENITVFDPNHRDLHVAYEASTGREDYRVHTDNCGGTTGKPACGTSQGKCSYYRLKFPSNFSTTKAGSYQVDIVYNCLENGVGWSHPSIGTVTVNVLAGETSISNNVGVVSKNAADDFLVYTSATSGTPATFNFEAGGRSTQVPITLGMLRTASGARIDTTKPGTYNRLVLTYNGVTVTSNYVLTVSGTTLRADMPVYPAPGSVDVDKVTTTSQDDFFRNSEGNGVANIQLSVKGKTSTKGVDLVIIMDLSSSMRYAVDGNTQIAASNQDANWDQTRLYKMEQALKTMIQKMQDDNMDVRIAMADFGDLDHYEFEEAVIDKAHRAWPQLEMVGGPAGTSYGGADGLPSFYAVNYNTEIANQLNFVLGKGDKNAAATLGLPGTSNNSQTFYLHPYKYDSNMATGFTGKILPKVYTGSEKVNAGAFVEVSSLTDAAMTYIIRAIDDQNQNMLGTNYDVGLEYAYRLAYARQQENIKNGEDRVVSCIFMSDGAAMQYNYFSGRAQSEAWSQYLVGNTDEITTNYDKAAKWNLNDYDSLHPDLKWTLERLRQMMHNGQLWFVDHNKGHNPNGSTSAVAAAGSIGHKCPNGTTYEGYAVYWPGPSGCTCGAPAADGSGSNFAGAFYGHTSGHTLDWYDIFELIYENRKNPALYGGTNPIGTNAAGNEFDYQGLIQRLREPGYTTGYGHVTGATADYSINTFNNERYQYQTYSPYWYFYNTEGKNWWAEAIKGDTGEVYPVINRHANKTTAEWSGDLYRGEVYNKYNGDNAPSYMKNDDGTGKDYISGFKGLGLDVYTVGFAITADDHMISVDEATTVLKNVATRPAMFYNTTDTSDLTDALNSIISSATNSATGSWFTDTMGMDYDLLTTADKNVVPSVSLKEYTVKYDAATNDYVPDQLVKTWETITFGGNGVAYLNDDRTTDIWSNDGGIRGDYLYYNANSAESGVTILLQNLRGTGLNYTLAPETFFWSVGNVQENVMVLEYQVYLNGSTEGTLSNTKTYYDTNEEAVFHYKDELGNMVDYDTVSPSFYWYEETSYSYGIYLVDDNGRPIKPNGTVVSGPSAALLGSDTTDLVITGDPTVNTLTASSVLESLGLDADLYEIYNPDAKVVITSQKDVQEHDIKITDTAGTKTTYVGSGKSDKKDLDNDGLESNKIYFAVKLKDYTTVVNYGIYLVDDNGNPILTNGSPASGPSAAAIQSGSESITVSSDNTVNSFTVEEVMQKLNLSTSAYEIYSPGTQVTVTSNKSQGSHSMAITDNTSPKTTYVGSDTSNKQNLSNDALSDNKIWFAVKLTDFATVVNYGIYLVDGNGNPIQKDGKPATSPDEANLGTGSTSIDVTSDNTKTTIIAQDVLAQLGLSSELYEIYSPGTQVEITSNKSKQDHDMVITDNTDPKTTYVGSNKSNKEDLDNNALADNKIHFAVKLKNRGSADTVVVDYGLSVDIDVLANDGFGEDSTLVGYQDPATYGSKVSVPDASANGASNAVKEINDGYATVTIADNNSRWQAKNMMFSNYYQYAYCAQDSATSHHYWSSVTVIPATSIYYEDSFVSFNEGDLADSDWSWAPWETEGTAIDDTQNQDRPGSQGQAIDADKIYGNDDAYKATTTFSGAARWTQVSANSPARASFTFTGTGFDVVSLTSSKTGSVMVFIYDANDLGANGKLDDPSTPEYDGTVEAEKVKTLLVNSYYSLEGTLYQVPVIKCSDLKYGTYVVELLVAYDEWFAEEKHDAGKFDFYLDSIRVYNPAGIVTEGTDNTIYDAYKQDGERWPRYQELRNMILAPEAVNGKVTSTEDISGMLFIDSGKLQSEVITYSNYASWGPNNELYMKTDDIVYFKLNTTKYLNEAFNDSDDAALTGVDRIHIAMRGLEGASKVKISGGSKVHEYEVSATDMYFDITDLANENVTIQVTGAGAVSITNIKITHTAMPSDYLAELGQAKSRRATALKSTVLNVNAPSMASLITVNGAMAAELLDELNKDQSSDAVITAKYASLSFKDLIHTNVYFEVDGISADNVGLAVFAGNDVDGTVDTASYVVSGAAAVNGMYKVSTKGIPAKNLGDTIYFKIFALEADGSYTYTKLLTYSPLEYANFLLTSGSDMDKTLAAAMLNYGAEAQKYFGYKTDALMNASVTAEAQALLAGYSIKDLDALDEIDAAKAGAFTATQGFAEKYPSVSFKGAFQINYYFKPSAAVDGDVTFYYWTEDTCNAVSQLTAENADGTAVMAAKNGVYSAVSGAIFAKNLDKTVYVAAVYEADGEICCTGILPYSVAEYTRAFADGDDAFAPFANATGIYGSVAKAYFGN